MTPPPGDCWVWDGWLGECKEWHRAEWWEYPNVFSIAAVLAVIAALIVIVMLIASRS